MRLEQTWRWFGPEDPVSLRDIKQAGASGVVTSLHHIPVGNVWPQDEILKRKLQIETQGLTWTIVESVPVHECIKTRSGEYRFYLDQYQQTLQNLGACGIKIVCYNFMAVMDWTRTNLKYTLKDESRALRFDMTEYIAFDVFMLERAGATGDYTTGQLAEAKHYFNQLNASEKQNLENTILMGLPGTVDNFSLEDFSAALWSYRNIDNTILKRNYYLFLKEVISVAEKAGVKMAVHPDDPPFSIFGLPRIVSTEDDLQQLLEAVDSENNGITFCTGSLGASVANNVAEMARKFAKKIHFMHLRNVVIEKSGSFYESQHLCGAVDMYEVVRTMLLEQRQRAGKGEDVPGIPIRPDHGHQMLDDLNKHTYPGYSAIGRLKGLAELRGLAMGISKSLNR